MIRYLVVASIGVAAGLSAMRTFGRSGPGRQTINRDSVAAAPGIAALHRADSAATIHGVATELRELWDADAIRITPGARPTITRAAIYKEDSVYRANNPNRSIIRYVARYPVLTVHGSSAVEWGGFDATYVRTRGAAADSASVQGTAMRVLKRQPDGSWRFALLVIESVH